MVILSKVGLPCGQWEGEVQPWRSAIRAVASSWPRVWEACTAPRQAIIRRRGSKGRSETRMLSPGGNLPDYLLERIDRPPNC